MFSKFILSSFIIIPTEKIKTGLSIIDRLIICITFPYIINKSFSPSLIFLTYFSSILYDSKTILNFISIICYLKDTFNDTKPILKIIFIEIFKIFNFFFNDFKISKINLDNTNEIYNNFKDLKKIIIYLFLLFIFEIIAFKICNKNLKRKIIHFIGFFIFLNLPKHFIDIFQFLIFFFLLLSFTKLPSIIFKSFVNNKDYGGFIFSHIYFLSGLIYSRIFLTYNEYQNLLISICIMDSFASIVGLTFHKNGKSFYGFISGQIFAYITEYFLKHKIDFKYHILMGLLESIDGVNDNILIPFASVLFYNKNLF